jgi:HK97 family phage major capsid protein
MSTKLLNSAIVLRKLNGVLTACYQRTTKVQGAGPAPSLLAGIVAFLAVLIRPMLALLAIAALLHFSPHGDHQTLMMASVSPALVAKRAQLQEKQKQIFEVLQLAKTETGVYDTSRKSVLEKLGAVDSPDAVAKFKSLNVELDQIGADLQQEELKEIERAAAERDTAMKQPVRGGAAVHPVSQNGELKSFGNQIIEMKEFQDWFKAGRRGNVSVELDMGMKTLFQTSAGFAPESVRTGLLVEGATRPIQLLDLIPTRPMNQASDKYMEETTRTHAAAEKAEGIAYAESTFAWTERTNPVQKITDSVPVTDEQLEDAPEVGGILDQRLRFGLRQRLDGQCFNGNGTSPNLRGMTQVVGIQTQAKGSDPIFDAIFKAMMLVRTTGRAFPNVTIMHPTDWQTVRLTRTADGLYIMGAPSEVGAQTLFGLPVPLCDAGSAGTAVVADLINFTYVGERRGIAVEIGYVNAQFTTGQKTIRADLRAVFTVTRPAAICTVTGL